MPIVSSSGAPATTTVQDIVNCVSQDVRAVLQTTSPDLAILLDYINRITNELLRFSRWTFMEATPQVFLTTPGITDYWIGSGTPPPGAVQTNLNLQDVFAIKRDDVIDRTQAKRLGHTDDPPVGHNFSFPSRPALWRNSPATPYVLNLYPPPNSNSHQFIPRASITTSASGGALGVRTYYLKMTFGDNVGGESAPSIEQIIVVPAHMLVTVASPVLPLTTDATTLLTATGPLIGTWNIYASQLSSGGETLQASGINLGVNWTEPSSGLTTSGRAVPGTNTLAALGGYVIEFNYWQTRQVLTDVAQVIQVPDTYRDIVCAGVNWLAFKYLNMDDEAKIWQQVFMDGKTQMVKDANQFPRGEEFIRPDPASTTVSSTSNIGLDASVQWSIP